MKKIIALILALVCCLSIVACTEDEIVVNGVTETVRCYSNSQPTRVETITVHDILDVDGNIVETLNGQYLLLAGEINGKLAAKETYVQEVLDDPQSASGVEITGPVKVQRGVEEYLEDMGRRTNGGAWRSKGLNFAPSMGAIAINITEENATNYVYTVEQYNNKLTFTVLNDKIGEVFGTYEDKETGEVLPNISADSDVTVEITNNGAVVTGITISYSIDEYDDFPARQVVVTTTYSYAVEKITIE